MKILQLVPYFIPYKGGQERYVYNLSKHLTKIGHEVLIITSNFPGAARKETMESIQVLRHTCIMRPLRNPIAPGMLADKNIVSDCDVIHTHNEHSFASMVACRYKTDLDKPLMITCHGQLKFGNMIADNFEKSYSRKFGKDIFNCADKIIALSSSDKEYISSLNVNSGKISILPNAVDTDMLSRLDEEVGGAQLLQGCDNKKVVLFTGPVIRRKGVEFLIQSIPMVIKHTPNAFFVFVGGGDFLTKAKEMVIKIGIEKHVLFTGSLSEHDLIGCYKSSDLFVLPSLSEGLPTSILEAMYFGLPVIATDIPGIRDHFTNSSLLVPPENPGELAKAIIRLLDDPVYSKSLSEMGHKLVKAEYTWDKVIRKYDDIYRKLAVNGY